MPDRAEDIATVASFILFMQAEQPDAVWGARRIEEVVLAFSRLVGIPVDRLKTIMIAGEMPPRGSLDGED